VTLRYLLDANIISDMVRRPSSRVVRHIARVGEGSVCTSIIVAAELRYGARKSGSGPLSERVDRILSAIEVVPLEAPADRHYGEIRDTLTRAGSPIGPNDLLIATHALALDLTIVTANAREFARVPSLRVENWLAG
jgi:tRNA(fMet)-specific endonuclease VapC